MAREDKDQETLEILADLERQLRRRIPLVLRRSPESLFEELEAPNLVIDLRNKLASSS